MRTLNISGSAMRRRHTANKECWCCFARSLVHPRRCASVRVVVALFLSFQQLTQPPAVDPRTPAELALDHEYAKEYSRRLMREERERQRADHGFLRARWTAINALPVSLRNEALKEDMTPWPKHFQPIPWTPQEYVKRFGNSGVQAAANAAAPGADAATKKQ